MSHYIPGGGACPITADCVGVPKPDPMSGMRDEDSHSLLNKMVSGRPCCCVFQTPFATAGILARCQWRRRRPAGLSAPLFSCVLTATTN